MADLSQLTKHNLTKVVIVILIAHVIGTVVVIEIVVIMGVVVDLVVETALGVVNQDTLLGNVLMMVVEAADMVVEMTDMEAVVEVEEVVGVMDLKGMETGLVAVTEMVVVMGEVTDIIVIDLGHMTVGVVEVFAKGRI